jgi:Arc/MetJ family transcription regulator
VNIIEATSEQLSDRLVQMQELMNSRGWPIFEAQMKREADAALANAVKSNDPYATAKYLAAHSALTQMLGWPLREATLAADSIRQHADMAKAEKPKRR